VKAAADPPVAPVSELDPGQQGRVNEAAVLAAEAEARRAEANAEAVRIEAKQAEDDRLLRKNLADKVFKAGAIQVVVADVVFLVFAFVQAWELEPSVISAWLGATVVQVIAVALVIARSLFPAGAQ
jgi:hypothetical protein